MTKVILIFGGESSEHPISCLSAQYVYDNIDRKKYELTSIVISKNGEWFFFEGNNFSKWEQYKYLSKVDNIVETLRSADVVFPVIHGAYGEDGRLQSLLEIFHIPYVGCDSKTSMLCMDKEYTKVLSDYYGIPILEYEVLTKKNLNKKREFPLIVKPANGGSSIGVSVVHTKKELKNAYELARKYDQKVIVEEYKSVRELEVALLSNGNKFYISNIGEILTNGEFYDFRNKYINKIETSSKCNISKKIEKRIYMLVEQLIKIFNIEGMSRIDFFYDEKEEMIYFNEINTLPGLTEISMYPKLMSNMNLDNKKLISKLLENC